MTRDAVFEEMAAIDFEPWPVPPTDEVIKGVTEAMNRNRTVLLLACALQYKSKHWWRLSEG